MPKAPKKPKFAKYPKAPKRGASLEVMKRYKERCKEVDKKNAEKAHRYNKRIDEIKTARKMREGIGGLSRTPKTHKLHTL